MAENTAILEPQVLRGVVEKFTTPENLAGLNLLPREPWPWPVAKWDVIRGSRSIARPNVPNSEAHIVPKLGVSEESASFIYLREKKVFQPTTIHWLRTPGTMARKYGERAVIREVRDLDLRFNNFAEWCIWEMMKGEIVLDYPDVQATINYGIDPTHFPTVATDWTTATIQQIIDDIKTWKRMIVRDSRESATDVFTTDIVMDYIFKAAAGAGTGNFISDRLKDEYFTTGRMRGFQGLNWRPIDQFYTNASGTETTFIDDNMLIMCSMANRPVYLLEGPSADDDAPENFTGKFSKTWKEKDPSARQYLLEWHFLPVNERPEQFIVVNDVTA